MSHESRELPATRSCNTDRGAWKIRCICMALSALLLASLFELSDLVAGNSLDSCDIGTQDFTNAEHLYGPCVICSTVNGVRSAHKTVHVRATRVGERVHIDWFTLPKKGVPGSLLLLDEYSAWVYLIECECKLPGNVILVVEKVLRDLDANNQKSIAEICTDAGNAFTSKEFHEECGKRHIRVVKRFSVFFIYFYFSKPLYLYRKTIH